MAKKSTKIALTYFITIIVSFLLVAGIGMALIYKFTNQRSIRLSDIQVTREDENADPNNGEYQPSALDNQTTLFILDAEERSTASVFVLTRMLPEEAKLLVIPLQSDTCVSANGEEQTLYEVYRANGSSAARRAIENVCDVSIDRYMKFDKNNFEKFAAQFNTVNYEAPYTLLYENPVTKEVTVIRQGAQALDPTTMRKLFTFPDFKNGETARNAAVGTVVVNFINSSRDSRLVNGMDQIVSRVLGSGVETDISEYDYEFKKDAMQYIVDNAAKPAELIMPSGNYDENGRYVLEDTFITLMRSRFGADLESIYGDPGSDTLQ